MATLSDERYKQLMAQVGFPDSQSLLQALKQVENEVSQHYRQLLSTERTLVDNVYAAMDEARMICRDEKVHALLSSACAEVINVKASR